MKIRGLRGSVFEDMINKTIETYRIKKLALIQKIPTPIVPMKIDNNGHITLAYFEKKSTVDYIGNVQEIPECFDAKECKTNKFSINNIHKHQFDYMAEWEEQGGISFVLILFIKHNVCYYLRFKQLKKFYVNKKDFTIDELEKQYFIDVKNKIKCEFIEKIQFDLNER